MEKWQQELHELVQMCELFQDLKEPGAGEQEISILDKVNEMFGLSLTQSQFDEIVFDSEFLVEREDTLTLLMWNIKQNISPETPLHIRSLIIAQMVGVVCGRLAEKEKAKELIHGENE